jgi:hypothetical protein
MEKGRESAEGWNTTGTRAWPGREGCWGQGWRGCCEQQGGYVRAGPRTWSEGKTAKLILSSKSYAAPSASPLPSRSTGLGPCAPNEPGQPRGARAHQSRPRVCVQPQQGQSCPRQGCPSLPRAPAGLRSELLAAVAWRSWKHFSACGALSKARGRGGCGAPSRTRRKKIMPARGPRSDLCVVVVTMSAHSNGDASCPAATRPLRSGQRARAASAGDAGSCLVHCHAVARSAAGCRRTRTATPRPT